MSAAFDKLQQQLDYQFNRKELCQEALTHRSHSSRHNERLEFLGDSVLDCVIAAELCEKFPTLPEGDLTRLRAELVRQDTLFEIAQELKLGPLLKLGEGELKSGGFRRPSILADALEAILGAAFVDSGYERARVLILHLYKSRLDVLVPAQTLKDPKTVLQEWLQGRKHDLPQYSLIAIRGEAHQQEFEAGCAVAALNLNTTGMGNSRRAAEQAAARSMLDLIGKK